MNPPTEQHDPPGSAGSFAAASEPAPAGGAGQEVDGQAGSNGTPGTPTARRALHARDAAARGSAAVPGQRAPEQRVPEQRVPEPSEPEPRAPGQRGPGGDDEPGIEFSIEAIEPVEEEAVGPNWLADQFSAIGRAVGRRLAGLGLALVVIAARDWLEAIAVLLQGVGGAIYPPIWLIGALITSISKKWDLRDKWLGLALPVLTVIFGATLTLVLGGQHSALSSYALEGWLAAGRLSRIAAVLGAVYLLWRLHRGLRAPRRPPWSTPRRRG